MADPKPTRQRALKFNEHASDDPEAALGSLDYHHTTTTTTVQSPGALSEKHSIRIGTPRHHLEIAVPDTDGLYWFWRRFTRAGKKKIGVMQSLRAFVKSSCTFSVNLNVVV
jgi:hypothetical protein